MATTPIITGSLIDIDSALPEPFNLRRLQTLVNRVESFQEHTDLVGLPEEATRSLMDGIARVEDEPFSRVEERDTDYGRLAVAEKVPYLVQALLAFPNQPRVTHHRPAASVEVYRNDLVTWSDLRGGRLPNGDPAAFLTLEVPSQAAFLEQLAEVEWQTMRANRDMEGVTVARGGPTIEPVDVVLCELVIREHRENLELAEGRGTVEVVRPEERLFYLLTYDGNSRTIWRRHHLAGAANSRKAVDRRIRDLMTTPEVVTLQRADNGGDVDVNVRRLRTTKELASRARDQVEGLRRHARVTELQDSRFDPEDELKRTVASHVIRADVVHSWRPAPDVARNAANFRATFDQVLAATHAQEPYPEEASDTNIILTALRVAPGDVLSPTDAGLMAGNAEVPAPDGVIDRHRHVLKARFPDDRPELGLLKVVGMFPWFLAHNQGRAVVRAVGKLGNLQPGRVANLHARGVVSHLGGLVEQWKEDEGFDLRNSHVAVLEYGVLPLDDLRNAPWTVTERSIEEILEAAIAELEVSPPLPLHERPAACELVALAVAPLALSGAITTPGGARKPGDRKLAKTRPWDIGASSTHGNHVPYDARPVEVMKGLASREPGLRQMALAITQFADAFAPGRTPAATVRAVDVKTGIETDDELDPARLICIALPEKVAQEVKAAKSRLKDKDGTDDGDGDDTDIVDPGVRIRDHLAHALGSFQELSRAAAGAVLELQNHRDSTDAAGHELGTELVTTWQREQMDVSASISTIKRVLEEIAADVVLDRDPAVTPVDTEGAFDDEASA